METKPVSTRQWLILLIGLLSNNFLAETIFSQTKLEIEGNISSDTKWTADKIIVTGDITILDGVTLEIDPGSYVEFQGHFKINVMGRILAYGTEDSMIIFTINDTAGFHNIESIAGGWLGIRFDNTPEINERSDFKFCIFEYGKATDGDITTNGPDDNGGCFHVNSYSKLNIDHCIIHYCCAETSGGAIWAGSSDITCKNSILCNNIAARSEGGAIILINSKSQIINNIIANNESNGHGGGVYIYNNTPKFCNNTVVNNKARSGGGGIAIYEKGVKLINNIIWGNKYETQQIYPLDYDLVSYCNVQGGFPGEGNIDYDPEFINPSAGAGIVYDGLVADWDISSTSACVNSGKPEFTWDSVGSYYDIRNLPRVGYDTIDIGAYEFTLISKIPGHIEAEDFYWMQGVIIEEADDIERNLNIGHTENNDCVLYITDVAYTGDYIIKFRLASENTTGKIKIGLFPAQVLDTIHVPYTVFWQNYATVPVKITLSKGINYPVFVFLGDNFIVNMNYFEVGIPNTLSVAVPAIIEAESFNDFSGIVIGWYDNGGMKEYVGWLDRDDYVEYKINAPEPGLYRLDLSEASASNGGKIEIIINDQKQTEIQVINTGSWESFIITTCNIELMAGENTVRLLFGGIESGICNIDYLKFVKIDNPSKASKTKQESNITVYPNPLKDYIVIESLSGNLIKQIELISITGTSVREERNLDHNRYLLQRESITPGLYLLKVVVDDFKYYRKVLLIN